MRNCSALVLLIALIASPATAAPARASGQADGRPPAAERNAPPREGVESGHVAYYGARYHGRRTASGERFDANALTMAHPTLPFGTRVRVTNPANGHSVVVRVNDRGPFGGHRIGDVSLAAAKRLGMVERGVIEATLEVVAAKSG